MDDAYGWRQSDGLKPSTKLQFKAPLEDPYVLYIFSRCDIGGRDPRPATPPSGVTQLTNASQPHRALLRALIDFLTEPCESARLTPFIYYKPSKTTAAHPSDRTRRLTFFTSDPTPTCQPFLPHSCQQMRRVRCLPYFIGTTISCSFMLVCDFLFRAVASLFAPPRIH